MMGREFVYTCPASLTLGKRTQSVYFTWPPRRLGKIKPQLPAAYTGLIAHTLLASLWPLPYHYLPSAFCNHLSNELFTLQSSSEGLPVGSLRHPHGHRSHSLIEMVELSALGASLLLSKWALPRTGGELGIDESH